MSDENDVDSIWASLKGTSSYVQKSNAKALGKTTKGKDGKSVNLEKKVKGSKTGKEKSTKKTSVKKNGSESDRTDLNWLLSGAKTIQKTGASTNAGEVTAERLPVLSSQEALALIARDVSALGSDEIGTRQKALKNILAQIFSKHRLENTQAYAELLGDICKPLFKRFADPAEKCRELSLRIIRFFFEETMDLVPTLGLFFPALMARLPAGLAYDEEQKIFVYNIEEHEAFRRGVAIRAQDKGGSTGIDVYTVVEPSEEVRLQSLQSLSALIHRCCHVGTGGVLHPYLHECVIFTQMQLRDPYPEVKAQACELISFLCQVDEFELGMKFFATALCRAIMPLFGHRHARVRIVAVRALGACMCVPDRAKVRGAGTEAMFDLVGFREDNHLSIAAFYHSEVRVNWLAKVAQDTSAGVREAVANMLRPLMTEVGDRYDHHTRLLPYLLDLIVDENLDVAAIALKVLWRCGEQMLEERNYKDDIIERQQYGIDGNSWINTNRPLPKPFIERPRLGVRMYVRNNAYRFNKALVGELTNWLSKVRLKSARLLKLICFLCEEHMTNDSYKLIPEYTKALSLARQDRDTELHQVLMEVFEIIGRFTHPDVYCHFFLSRLRGDPGVTVFGIDNDTRSSVLQLLCQFLTGTRPNLIPEHFAEICSTLCDPRYVDFESSTQLREYALETLLRLLQLMQSNEGGVRSATAAAFLSTGRLNGAALESGMDALFGFFLQCQAASTAPPSPLSTRGHAARMQTLPTTLHRHQPPPSPAAALAALADVSTSFSAMQLARPAGAGAGSTAPAGSGSSSTAALTDSELAAAAAALRHRADMGLSLLAELETQLRPIVVTGSGASESDVAGARAPLDHSTEAIRNSLFARRAPAQLARLHASLRQEIDLGEDMGADGWALRELGVLLAAPEMVAATQRERDFGSAGSAGSGAVHAGLLDTADCLLEAARAAQVNRGSFDEGALETLAAVLLLLLRSEPVRSRAGLGWPVLQAFILEPVWASTPRLQAVKLDVLEALLQTESTVCPLALAPPSSSLPKDGSVKIAIIDEDAEEEEKQEEKENEKEKEEKEEEERSENPVSPVHASYTAVGALLSSLGRVVSSVGLEASLRLRAMHLYSRVADMARGAPVGDVQRIKPLRPSTSTNTSAVPYEPDSWDAWLTELLCVLDDADLRVRQVCMHTLANCCSLLTTREAVAKVTVRALREAPEICRTAETAVTTLKMTPTAGAGAVVDSDDEANGEVNGDEAEEAQRAEEAATELDVLLRCLGSLASVEVLALVRTNVESAPVPARGPCELLTFLSGLVDHCELVAQLSASE
jgi:hypothetical protein